MQLEMDGNGLAKPTERERCVCEAAHRVPLSPLINCIVPSAACICKLSTVTNGVRTLYTPTKRQSIVKTTS